MKNSNDKKPRVFITQEVTSVDYSPAVEFGDLVFVTAQNDRLTPYPQSPSNAHTVRRIRDILKDFDPDLDYLICTGAPSHMAICGSVLGGKLRRMLVWDNRESRYFKFVLDDMA